MKDNPVFIHSMWRSGSTWLFHKFRESSSGYWCYQEPFHEELINLNNNPDNLLKNPEETVKILRHPNLTKPYFQEFYDIKDFLIGKFVPCISYDSFFDQTICPEIVEYTRSLIDHAQGKPVLHFCRSFGRVSFLKNTFGGAHIILWRDPISQWFSYQVTDYFDIVNLLVVNSKNSPPVILAIRNEIGLNLKEGSSYHELSHFPWDSRKRYLLFYSLWLYHLIENHQICHLDLNIDLLSNKGEYRQHRQNALEQHGIFGVDLSGCSSPITFLSDSEKSYFYNIENRVERIFLGNGYSLNKIQECREMRSSCSPQKQAGIPELWRNSEQSRRMALSYADRVGQAEERAVQAEERAVQAEERAVQAEERAVQAEERAVQAEAASKDHLMQLHAVYNSRSWRVTAPLRWYNMQVLRLQKEGVKSRLKELVRKIRAAAAPGPITHRRTCACPRVPGKQKSGSSLREKTRLNPDESVRHSLFQVPDGSPRKNPNPSANPTPQREQQGPQQ